MKRKDTGSAIKTHKLKLLNQDSDRILEKLVYQRIHDGKKAIKVNLPEL